MKILVACEESQRVCIAFRDLDQEAYSCDIQDCSGNHPEWHIKDDALKVLSYEKWDMVIAHPPCTFLTNAGIQWFDETLYGEKAILRKKRREEAVQFFMKFIDYDCPRICVENPIGYMNTYYRKPDQIIHPWMFGDNVMKATCLWLKGLPKLVPEVTQKPKIPMIEYYNENVGRTFHMSKWYADTWKYDKNERAKIRSKTFPGIAKAMAKQWSILGG